MRILVVCPGPPEPELGAAQMHLNLASALRGLGHTVEIWSPEPMPEKHWSHQFLSVRAGLGAFLQSSERFDVIDCPALLTCRRFRTPNVRWVCRSTAPEIPYMYEDVRDRPGGSARRLAKTAAVAAWSVGIGTLIHRGWSVADVVMCLGRPEHAWVAGHFPGLRGKLRSYDGALSESDRAVLDRVRLGRRPSRHGESIRYLSIGRWASHKGVDRLLEFMRERLSSRADEQFTVAGCGSQGERALGGLVASGRVRVIPSFRRSELPELLAAHDAGLFTSRVEGWGLVLNEMVESGLPVFATNAGGVAEIREVLGAFVQEFPPPRTVVLPPLPGDEARQRYGDRFQWHAIAVRYLSDIMDPRPAQHSVAPASRR